MIDAAHPVQILIVDDEPSTRLLLRRWIERSFPAEVQEASDGLEALEAISSGRTEMVISDINMPVLNGVDMLTLMQSDPNRERLEVLVASKIASEEKIRQVIALGVSDYLLKPLQYDWVSQRLKRAVERIEKRRARGEDVGERLQARALVADGDPNFFAFVESALCGHFDVDSSRSVAETLVKALRWKPDVVLLSPKLSGLRFDFLKERLGSLPGVEPPNIIELLDPGASPKLEGASAALERSFVPEKFRSNLMALLRTGSGPALSAFAWLEFVEGELATALHQALGMMTGSEPELSPADSEPVEYDLFGSIQIPADSGEYLMRIDLWCRRSLAKSLATAMLGGEETDDEAFQLDALREVLNVVAGRVKNSCQERKIKVTIGLPQIVEQQPQLGESSQFKVERTFQWNGETFWLSFRADPASTAVETPMAHSDASQA